MEFVILLHTFLEFFFLIQRRYNLSDFVQQVFRCSSYFYFCCQPTFICLGLNITSPFPYFVLCLDSDGIKKYSLNNLITACLGLCSSDLNLLFHFSFRVDLNIFCSSFASSIFNSPDCIFFENFYTIMKIVKNFSSIILKIIY